MPKVFSALSGSGLKARFIRSSGLRTINFGATQFLRLASNLVLTRLLFPEAFGVMALVMVFLVGLSMFSDVGTKVAIQQSKRGDDPVFLDTAWSLQILRGIVLWITTWPLGWAISIFYDTPLLAWLLPAAGLTLLIDGLKPMRAYSAQRHLQLGRLTAVELGSSVVSMIVTIFLAWWLQSVWALIWGMVVAQSLRLVLLHIFLEGRRDKLGLNREAAGELIGFGKWIFLSTVCGFLNQQGDRLILGKYITLEALGIYHIAYFLASFPVMLGQAVFGQVMLPYLREKPPSDSYENFLAFRRIRMLGTGGLIVLVILMALFGPYLVLFLYDARYAAAGGVVVLISFASIPLLIVQGYGKVSLPAGNSRSYAKVIAIGAFLSVGFLSVGAASGGVVGALIGLFLARICHYPVVANLAHQYNTWDPKLDVGFALLGLAGGGLALYIHYPVWSELLPF